MSYVYNASVTMHATVTANNGVFAAVSTTVQVTINAADLATTRGALLAAQTSGCRIEGHLFDAPASVYVSNLNTITNTLPAEFRQRLASFGLSPADLTVTKKTGVTGQDGPWSIKNGDIVLYSSFD